MVAINVLEAGYDSGSLRKLAGLENPSIWEAEPLWFESLKELGQKIVSKGEAMLLIADGHIRGYFLGQADLSATVRALSTLWRANAHDHRLTEIYCIAEYLDIGQATEDDLRDSFRRFQRREFESQSSSKP